MPTAPPLLLTITAIPRQPVVEAMDTELLLTIIRGYLNRNGVDLEALELAAACEWRVKQVRRTRRMAVAVAWPCCRWS